MQKPALVVMAAGLGSRFGGLKQVQAVGPHDQRLMDYALYDAKRAGFEDVIFIISRQMEETFPVDFAARFKGHLNVRYAVQEIDDLPQGFSVPEGRVKPWGTGHAVRACRGLLSSPFAAINADDYYGRTSFQKIYDFLVNAQPEQPPRYAMVGFELYNTLSESGYVARGICKTDFSGNLVEIKERTHIVSTQEGALYTEDGRVYTRLPEDSIASMNLWGFTLDFMEELDQRFAAFLDQTLRKNPLKGEYFLPEVVGSMLREHKAEVSVLPCSEKWYGVTYKEDMPVVAEAIRRMTESGIYPEKLWA